VMRIIFAATRARDPPRYLGGKGLLPAALPAAIGGSLILWAYLLGNAWFDLFTREMALSRASFARWPLALPALAIVAAPLFEEYIFRGLIFGGLRRSRGFLFSAAASAAIFAVVHPTASVAPVFVLGLLAAFAYERSGSLAAPVIVHAAYNAAAVAAQLSLN